MAIFRGSLNWVHGDLHVSGSGNISGSLTLGGGIGMNAQNAGIEQGSTSITNTPYHDFHTGFPNDYDVRLLASGGTNGTNGAGLLNIIASALQRSGHDVLDTTDFPYTKGGAGYQTFSSGIEIQWGSASNVANGTRINFPRSFPTSCVLVLPIAYTTSYTQVQPLGVSGFNTSSFILYTPATVSILYLALGY